MGAQKIVTCLILTIIGLVAAVAAVSEKDGGQNSLEFALKIFGVSMGKDNAITPQKEIKLIGAGFSRTGTKSTKAALTKLGYKVFHMEDLMSLGFQRDYEKGVASDYFFKKFIQKILDMGYNATLDGPMNGYTLKLAEMFPNAKILYTVRDSPEEWAASFHLLQTKFRYVTAFPASLFIDTTFWTASCDVHFNFVLEYPTCKPGSSLLTYVPWFHCVDPPISSRPLPDVYRDWDRTVNKLFGGTGRMLTFSVKQGWEPLMGFLGKPMSEVNGIPFPNINEAATLDIGEKVGIIIGLVWPIIVVVFFLIALYLGEFTLKVIRKVKAFVVTSSKHAKL